jgi:hypothetical protein
MKTLFIVVTAFLTYLNQSIIIAQQPSVTLENIQAEYKSLAEVKPILMNVIDKPIYLLPKECGEAQVSFLSGEYWWDSDLKDCPEFLNPVEIKPGEIYHIPSLVIRIEEDEGKYREERIGIPGKYKVTISYSYNPTYRDGKPELRRSISKEFSIIK